MEYPCLFLHYRSNHFLSCCWNDWAGCSFFLLLFCSYDGCSWGDDGSTSWAVLCCILAFADTGVRVAIRWNGLCSFQFIDLLKVGVSRRCCICSWLAVFIWSALLNIREELDLVTLRSKVEGSVSPDHGNSILPFPLFFRVFLPFFAAALCSFKSSLLEIDVIGESSESSSSEELLGAWISGRSRSGMWTLPFQLCLLLSSLLAAFLISFYSGARYWSAFCTYIDILRLFYGPCMVS